MEPTVGKGRRRLVGDRVHARRAFSYSPVHMNHQRANQAWMGWDGGEGRASLHTGCGPGRTICYLQCTYFYNLSALSRCSTAIKALPRHLPPRHQRRRLRPAKHTRDICCNRGWMGCMRVAEGGGRWARSSSVPNGLWKARNNGSPPMALVPLWAWRQFFVSHLRASRR